MGIAVKRNERLDAIPSFDSGSGRGAGRFLSILDFDREALTACLDLAARLKAATGISPHG